MGKPILAVKPWGNERIPQAVQDNATLIVNWNSASFISGLKALTVIASRKKRTQKNTASFQTCGGMSWMKFWMLSIRSRWMMIPLQKKSGV